MRLRVWFGAAGAAFVIMQLVLGFASGLFTLPGGDTLIWDRVGDEVRAGFDPYYVAPVRTDSFWYAPTWAVLFAALTWLPPTVLWGIILVAKISSLRYLGGSWVGAGIACWFPLVAFDLAGGSFNLVIAAGILAAVRRRPALAVVTALAKVGPALAIHPRDWRPALTAIAIAVAVTLPVFGLWTSWVHQLVANVGEPLGPQIPIPLALRLVAAVGLLLLVRRPWARALAAAIAIPAFYWLSFVVLLAPVAVWSRPVEGRGAGETPSQQ